MPSSSDLLLEMNSCIVAALNAKRTRCIRFSFKAVGNKEVTNLATSVFRSISVTRDTRGTFCAADLNGNKKLQVELGLECGEVGRGNVVNLGRGTRDSTDNRAHLMWRIETNFVN